MTSKYQGQFGIIFSRIASDKELPYIIPLRYRFIVGAVGLRYSGKSFFSSYLVSKLGYSFYSLSQYIRDEVNRLGLSLNDNILQDLGNELRNRYGEDYLARRTIQELYREITERKETNNYVVIEGIRSQSEVDFFKRLPRFYLIQINAPSNTRHDRALQEGSFKGTLGDFEARFDRDMQNPLKMIRPEYNITNDGTKKEFISKCDEILREINTRQRF